MKKIQLTLGIILLINGLYAQDTITTSLDTDIEEEAFENIEEEVVDEVTRVTENSILNIQSQKKGYHLFEVKSICCQPVGRNLKERIVLLDFENDTLSVILTLMEECNASFLCEISITDDTLNFISKKIDHGWSCFCEFELEYKIVTSKHFVKHYQLNGKKVELTEEVYKKKKFVKTTYPNGKKKTLSVFLDEEKIYEFHFDENGKRTKVIKYKNGKSY